MTYLLWAPVLIAAATFVHWGGEKHGFERWQVVALDATYFAVMFLWVL